MLHYLSDTHLHTTYRKLGLLFVQLVTLKITSVFGFLFRVLFGLLFLVFFLLGIIFISLFFSGYFYFFHFCPVGCDCYYYSNQESIASIASIIALLCPYVCFRFLRLFSLPSSTSLNRAWSNLFSSSLFCPSLCLCQGSHSGCHVYPGDALWLPDIYFFPFYQRQAEKGIILWML